MELFINNCRHVTVIFFMHREWAQVNPEQILEQQESLKFSSLVREL